MTAIADHGPHQAPDHIVAMVAAFAPRPVTVPEAVWFEQVRRVADYVWGQAWYAGAVDSTHRAAWEFSPRHG